MKKIKSDHSRIPLPDLIQEGNNKQYVCHKDREMLLRHGLDEKVFSTLGAYTRACIDTDTAWQICLKTKKITTGQYTEMIAQGKTYRAKLAKQLRKIPLVKNSGCTFPNYRVRRKYEDIIEDLYELYTLGYKLLEADSQCIPDSTMVYKALELHETLRELRKVLAGIKSRKAICSTERTKAARALKELIDTIHAVGQNAFVNDPAKAARYKYGFYLVQNSKRNTRKKKSKSLEIATVLNE